MADTVLKFNVEADKDFFHDYDRTGAYSKKNKGGWGSPNHELSDVKSAKVRIYLPEATTFIEVDVFPYLPNTKCVGMEIIPNDLNLDAFDPGVYKFEFINYLHNGLTLCETCYIFFWQPLECCISKKRMNTDLNDASSPEALKVLELEALLNNAKWCACGGKMDCAQEISDYIWTNCGCCC
jgi:hypothetical protein